MNAIQVSLASLVMLGGLFVTPPAVADHLQDAEERTNALQRQTVEYVRWFRYHVPQSELSPQLRRDASAVLSAVNRLQESMLFTGSTPAEVRQLHHQVHEVDQLVNTVYHRIKDYHEAARHGGRFGGIQHDHGFGGPGLEFRLGRGIVMSFPDGRRVIDDHRLHRHDRRDLDRLRDGLRGLESRLERVHRTLHDIDEELQDIDR